MNALVKKGWREIFARHITPRLHSYRLRPPLGRSLTFPPVMIFFTGNFDFPFRDCKWQTMRITELLMMEVYILRQYAARKNCKER